MAKKKQAQKETVSLETFLSASTSAENSWEDDTHELPSAPLGRDQTKRVPNREDRKAPVHQHPPPKKINLDNVPQNPPFVAYVGHLPYDMDTNSLGAIFYNRGCTIKSEPRILKDGDRSKGFGYIEFQDRESFIKALEMDGYQVKNRSIRVDIAVEKKEQSSRPFIDRSSMGSKSASLAREPPMEDPKLAAPNWRSEKPSPKESDLPTQELSDRAPSHVQDRYVQLERRQDTAEKRLDETDQPPKSDYSPRGRSGNRQRTNDGSPYSNPSPQDRGSGMYRRHSGQRHHHHHRSRSGSYNARHTGNHDHYRNNNNQDQRRSSHYNNTNSYSSSHNNHYSNNNLNYRQHNNNSNNYNRSDQRNHRSYSNYDNPRSHRKPMNPPSSSSSSSTSTDHTTTATSSEQRPKLNLAPRTLPLVSDGSANTASPLSTASPSSASSTKSNPFGAAKPVDTTQAIKKVEEKIEALKLSIKAEKPISSSSSTSTAPPAPRSSPRSSPSFSSNVDPSQSSSSSSFSRSKSPNSTRSRSPSAPRKSEEKHDSVPSSTTTSSKESSKSTTTTSSSSSTDASVSTKKKAGKKA